jgi:glycosyltransferase involved in cell wall biosynthesis
VVGVAPLAEGIIERIPPEVRVIEIKRRSTLFSFFQLFIYGFIFSRNTDVLITSLYPAAIAGRLLRILKPNIILVSLEHNTKIKNIFRRWLLSKTSVLVDLSFSDCRTTLDFSKSIYLNSKTILDEIQLVAQQPVDKKMEVSREGKTLNLVSVGRMVEQKNYSHLLHELKLLKNKNIDFQLTLIGDGPERNELEEMSSLLGIDDQVLFFGHRDDVDQLLAQADIYIQSSLWEGQCFTVVEAMAAALPVITTNVGGLSDYTVDGFNCLHFKASNEGELANAVVRIANDPLLAQKLSTNALETVRTSFSHESQQKSVEKMLGTIQRLKNGKR